MKELIIPLLTEKDIEVRIGQVTKDESKASLLLYKTARTDAQILDDLVGAGNWQKKFYVLQGVGVGETMRSIVVCSVGIYDDDKKEWVWKDDSGTESNVEQDKGVCSDSFKRAAGGGSWGIGSELYSAPTIWVPITSKYDKFFVSKIGYNDRREISDLIIVNEKGECVYSMNERKPNTVSNKSVLISKITKYLIRHSDKKTSFYDWISKTYGTTKLSDMEETTLKEICDKIFKGGSENE